MGNHEYCEKCGESDFHYHRPCDPAKLLIRELEEQKELKARECKLIELKNLQKELNLRGYYCLLGNGKHPSLIVSL